MKIPNKIKILAHNYLVKEIDGLADDGSLNWLEKTILINKKLPQSRKEAVLFHEILHAINGEIDEKEVEFLTQTIYQILNENKLLK